MTLKNNGNYNAENRLRKAKAAWILTKNGPTTNINIKLKIRLNLCKTLILSILTYSINLSPLNKTILLKMQSSYSNCLREITIGHYNETVKPQILTLEEIITYLQLKVY